MKPYMKMVETSHLGSSDEVRCLLNFDPIGKKILCFYSLQYWTSLDSLLWQVVRLMERVEATFIKHFANANRTKGMNILRPKAKRERHRLTFSTGIKYKVINSHQKKKKNWSSNFLVLMRILVPGFLGGCIFSLIVALAAIIRTRDLLQQEDQEQYMNTMFPLYR